jgi:hypothetical protein
MGQREMLAIGAELPYEQTLGRILEKLVALSFLVVYYG